MSAHISTSFVRGYRDQVANTWNAGMCVCSYMHNFVTSCKRSLQVYGDTARQYSWTWGLLWHNWAGTVDPLCHRDHGDLARHRRHRSICGKSTLGRLLRSVSAGVGVEMCGVVCAFSSCYYLSHLFSRSSRIHDSLFLLMSVSCGCWQWVFVLPSEVVQIWAGDNYLGAMSLAFTRYSSVSRACRWWTWSRESSPKSPLVWKAKVSPWKAAFCCHCTEASEH